MPPTCIIGGFFFILYLKKVFFFLHSNMTVARLIAKICRIYVECFGFGCVCFCEHVPSNEEEYYVSLE